MSLINWIDDRFPLSKVWNEHMAQYYAPKNFNFWYYFGALSLVVLVLQIVTGIILTMHYKPDADLAFASVEYIMRDVPAGWFVRYLHGVGASMFFLVVYLHMFRAMLYGSHRKPRELIWLLGMVIYVALMAEAFFGYLLPWGNMSYWGAQVIISLFGAIPVVGEPIQTWLLGGFAPGNASLNRFFSLHFLLPFVIAAVVILHIWALHIPGSSNPTGVEVKGPQDTVPFHPYYTAKDGFGAGVFLILFAILLFFAPNYLGHPDNYIEANPLSTPAHIVPEWYFWPFYAILRAFTVDFFFVPAKLLGVLAMFASILLLFFLPWLDTSPVRSGSYRPTFKTFFWILVLDVLILGYCGGAPAEEPYVMISQVAAAYYFAHFLIILPMIARFEKPLPLPNSITEAVLAKYAKADGETAAVPAE